MHPEPPGSRRIRVALADPHPIVLAGLQAVLEHASEVDIVGRASEADEALKLLHAAAPEVAVLEPALFAGPDPFATIIAQCPTVKLLALTGNENEGHLRRLLKRGARGIALKRSAPEEIARAVRVVATGKLHIDPTIAGPLLIGSGTAAAPELSVREEAVLKLIALGYTGKEAALDLGLSSKSVTTYRDRGARKLKLRTRTEIVRYAAARGWLDE
jgi:DNA-binding NarL/FixJ family response regulator